VLIASIASPAGALSPITCTGDTLVSWIYVLFRVGGTCYVTSFQANNTCGNGGNNQTETCVNNCASGVSFTLKEDAKPANLKGANKANYASYNTSNLCGSGTQLTDWTFLDGSTNPTCSTYITQSNGKIFAQGGAELLAAVACGAGSNHKICPSGGFICGLE